MSYIINSILFLIFTTLSDLSARDDTISDSLSSHPVSEKSVTKKKSIAYNLNNSIKSIFQQEINLPEMINYIYEAELGDNLEKIATKLAVSQKKIREWNNLKEGPINIYAGKKLTVWIPNDSSDVSLTHFGKRQILHNAMTQKPDLFYHKDEFESSQEYKQRKQKQKEFIALSENNFVAEALINKLKRERKKELEMLKKALEEEKKIITSLSLVEGQLISVGNYDADAEKFDSILISFKTTYIYEDVKIFAFGSRLYGSVGENRFGSKYFQNFMEMNLYESVNGAIMRLPEDMIYQLKVPEVLYLKEEGLGLDKDIIKVALKEPIRYEVYRENFIKERAYYNFHLKRDDAKELKRKFRFAKIEGFRRLNEKGQYFDYFNLVLVHPTTGERFSFGPTKDIEGTRMVLGDKPAHGPHLKITSVFIEDNGNGMLDPNEKAKIKVIIDNIGKGPAVGLALDIKNEIFNDGILFDSYKVVGTIDPGKSKQVTIDIEASKDVRETKNTIEISATESYGYYPKPARIKFETSSYLESELALIDYGVNTKENGNKIVKNKVALVQVRVQNRGLGMVEDVTFNISLPKDVYFEDKSKRSYSFPMLKSGEFRDLEFSFMPEKNMPKNLNIAVSYDEKNSSGVLSFDLETNQPQGNIKYFDMRARMAPKEDLFGKRPIRLVDIEANIPNFGRNGQADMAVIFGIENYKMLSGVDFAKRDAYWIKRYFQRILGIPAENIFYKTDAEANKDAFEDAFSGTGWLSEKIKKNQSNVFVYFAGKGASDSYTNTAYLVPYNGTPETATKTGYKLSKMYDQLINLGPSSVTIFLDACFTGLARTRTLNLIDTAPVIFDADKYSGKNLSVFFATTDMETSSSIPAKKHGLFSYYLMKGLTGRADLNRDKRLTVKDLGKYLERNIPVIANLYDERQTPNMKTSNDKTVLLRY